MVSDIHLEERAELHAAVVHDRVPISMIGDVIARALAEVGSTLGAQHVSPSGPPFARYRMADGAFEVWTGFPITAPLTPNGRVESTTLPNCTVATAMHVGPYDQVAQAYREMLAWCAEHEVAQAGDAWETYLDGPEVAQPRTVISIPVRPTSV